MRCDADTYAALSRALAPPTGDPAGFADLGLGAPSRAALEAEHQALFGRTGPARVPPYEGCYRPQDLHRVLASYAEVGLAPDPSFHDRPDHVSAELACMEVLSRREETAGRTGDTRSALLAAGQREAFFRRHVGTWVPTFFETLAGLEAFDVHRRLAGCATTLLRRERHAEPPPAVAGRPASLPPSPRCTRCGGELGFHPPDGDLPMPSWGLVCVPCRIRPDLKRKTS